jgi:hypothetical protein
MCRDLLIPTHTIKAQVHCLRQAALVRSLAKVVNYKQAKEKDKTYQLVLWLIQWVEYKLPIYKINCVTHNNNSLLRPTLRPIVPILYVAVCQAKLDLNQIKVALA